MVKRLLLCLALTSTLMLAACLIKGRVVDESGAGKAGVMVSLNGVAPMTATTDSNGVYQFGTAANLLTAGDYTVTPSGKFIPASTDVTITSSPLDGGGDICLPVVDVNFVAVTNTQEDMSLTSPSFEDQGDIPIKHTCDGDDISPALNWSNVPQGTKSLALIVDDPDAPDPANPQMTWVHWVLYNIPADAGTLAESVTAGNLPAGTLQGRNDWGQTGYGGPCPPIGKHRYFHKLYALDIVLADLNQPTKAGLEAAMQGHVIASAQLVGLYQSN